MRTAASEIAAAPSAGRRILISSSSFSPAATLNEAVPDMAERAATSRQARSPLPKRYSLEDTVGPREREGGEDSGRSAKQLTGILKEAAGVKCSTVNPILGTRTDAQYFALLCPG
ncbi:unnamed protein product [Pleuronectes platessa]|uniref:Uncharacterized protein n=1 Tax=Pleuronectes platessa TaxID=8262 RepID=A0A9N7V2L4_PLEPL|nr:unnamed protein product [Pleuronectes platessa]